MNIEQIRTKGFVNIQIKNGHVPLIPQTDAWYTNGVTLMKRKDTLKADAVFSNSYGERLYVTVLPDEILIFAKDFSKAGEPWKKVLAINKVASSEDFTLVKLDAGTAIRGEYYDGEVLRKWTSSPPRFLLSRATWYAGIHATINDGLFSAFSVLLGRDGDTYTLQVSLATEGEKPSYVEFKLRA